MKSETSDLDQLAIACGIQPDYYDYRSRLTPIADETKCAAIASLGYDVSDANAIKASLKQVRETAWREILEPVTVIREDRTAMLRLSVPASMTQQKLVWGLALENGELMEGHVLLGDRKPKAYRLLGDEEYRRYMLQLPANLPVGYHDFELRSNDGPPIATARLIITPMRCHEPQTVGDGSRRWGFALQLYTLSSERSWGMGDLADLRDFVTFAAGQGADFVGLNPLHALYPSIPGHCSPYSPSSRGQLNMMYVSPQDVPEFDTCQGARSLVASPGFQSRLERVCAAERVDYDGVAALKLPVLRKLYRHFRERHLARNTGRAQAFERYVAELGDSLYLHALYDALQEYFYTRDREKPGWQQWPADFRDPQGPAATEFARRERESIEFYQYLQWLTDEQLALVQRTAQDAGMAIGIYRDLAVGVDGNGAESWANQALYCLDMSVGAPPDALALKGQDWGLPPMSPAGLKARGYRDLIAMLRANMRHCGALRMDHVMALMRLWWVPAGCTPDAGLYLRYPLEDMLGILALESQRNRCIVIGEDLGVVPEEIRGPLREAGVYSYRVLYFERDERAEFFAPEEYPEQALCTITTHDLATFCGYWEQRDLELRDQLGLYPDDSVRATSLKERELDRAGLIAALRRTDSKAVAAAEEGISVEGVPATTPWALSVAVHEYLAATPCALMAVQPEDLLQMRDPVNVPGTSTEYPNWSRRLTASLEQMRESERFGEACQRINDARRAGQEASPERKR